MAESEDILSVISGDNQLVKKMGLTHPELAKTLFHLWNVIQVMEYYNAHFTNPGGGIDFLMYNGRKIVLTASSGHGTGLQAIASDVICVAMHETGL